MAKLELEDTEVTETNTNAVEDNAKKAAEAAKKKAEQEKALKDLKDFLGEEELSAVEELEKEKARLTALFADKQTEIAEAASIKRRQIYADEAAEIAAKVAEVSQQIYDITSGFINASIERDEIEKQVKNFVNSTLS